MLRSVLAMLAGAVVAGGLAASAYAQSQPAEKTPQVLLELNKVEQVDNACRAYLLFENNNDTAYTDFRLDLVLFSPDGVITRRIAVDAAPLRAGRPTVKLFDLTDLKCDSIQRILVNDVSPCTDGSGAREDCVEALGVRSRADGIEFFQ
mgnify:FL=1